MKNLPANYLDHEQGSPEWLKAKNGHVSASRVGEILKRKKNGDYYQTRRDYMDDLQGEILSGLATENYVTAAMQRGIDYEDVARGAYEAHNGVFVKRVGFVLHPTIKRCGASPDGLVGKDGGLEIKVPQRSTHIRWRRAGVVPDEHLAQILLNMDCCEREWWDFFSFDPDIINPELRRFQVRIHRTPEVEAAIKKMREEIEKFLEELTTELLNMTDPLTKQLERSVEASKAFRKVHSDAELMEQLRDEGIQVP